jgi:DNA primase
VSRPADLIHQLPANQPDRKGVAEDSEDRLVKRLRVSKKMRSFARRMRVRVSDLDLGDPATASQFERSREKMANILAKKKIPVAKAKRAIAEALELAADHQLQGLRQKDSQRDRVRSARDASRLSARLEELAEAIAKLPPVSKKRLNAIVEEYTAQFFDTETFNGLISALAVALPELGPKRRAQA